MSEKTAGLKERKNEEEENTTFFRTDDVNIELAVCDGVVAIAMVTCRADDAVRAEREAVIGRRVAIVRAGVIQRLLAVARAKPDGRFRNDRSLV